MLMVDRWTYVTVPNIWVIFSTPKEINNKDMIDDRVNLGLKCMISSMALASEITLGQSGEVFLIG